MEKIKRKTVTPTELYALDENPEFVGQSRADKDGNYIMVWRINEKEYQTENNLRARE